MTFLAWLEKTLELANESICNRNKNRIALAKEAELQLEDLLASPPKND